MYKTASSSVIHDVLSLNSHVINKSLYFDIKIFNTTTYIEYFICIKSVQAYSSNSILTGQNNNTFR